MSPYRCYFRDKAGHIMALHTISCRGDDEAKAKAAELFRREPHHALELWAIGRPLLRLTRDSASDLADDRSSQGRRG